MHVALTVEEAVAALRSVAPVPEFVRDVRGAGSAVEVDVDLGAVPGGGSLRRMTLSAVGTATLAAHLIGYADGTATFEIKAEARGVPAHRLLNLLTAQLDEALRGHGLSEDVVQVRQGPRAPLLLVHVQDAIDAKAEGVTLTGLELRGGTAHANLVLAAPHLR